MAVRTSRPRIGFPREDPMATHEETNMWTNILTDLKRARDVNMRSKEAMNKAVELETMMGKDPSLAKQDELGALYREGLRLAEEERRILHEEPCDVIKNLGLLQALRVASENEPIRNPQPPKSRNQKNKPKIDTDGAAESPGLSPIVISAKVKSTSVRSGSVTSTKDLKEPFAKSDEGAEGSKGTSAEKAGKLVEGAEVAYKQAKMNQWIQCNIVSILETGNKKRIYEVQDPEPDETGGSGQIYKAQASELIAIPTADAILADYPVGKQVLAQYPETTTFYSAEVTGMRKGFCRLKFEDDQNKELEVARRFVLDFYRK